MNTHLSIEVEGKKLTLPSEDFAIDIDMQNPMFNDEDTFSYPIQVPLDGNRHFVQNLEDKRSTLRPVSLENKKARIYTDGFPFFTGKISTSDDEEVTDSISLNVEGENTLADLIADLDCQDIPVKDDILIGEKLGEITVQVKGTLKVACHETHHNIFDLGEKVGTVTFNPQALGFSVPYCCTESIYDEAEKKSSTIVSGVGIADKDGNLSTGDYEVITPKKYGETDTNPGKTYINVSTPYPDKEYCNARVSYKHYKLAGDGTTDTDNTESNPYMVLDAERPQSGICFYVQYFLDCLFAYLGLEWDNSVLKDIEDFNRLCFYTTKCSYDEDERGLINETSFDEVNKWLSSRGCGAQLGLKSDWGAVSAVYIPRGTLMDSFYTLDDDCFEATGGGFIAGKSYKNVKFSIGSGVHYDKWSNVDPQAKLENLTITSVKGHFVDMYANSGNFPDESVSTILESLENQFGIRFIYDAKKKKVTAKLLRDMYRDQDTPRQFFGTVIEMNKMSEKITGVRVCYADESDSKEQRNNLRDQSRDYDTSYDYIDYPDPNGTTGKSGTSTACTTDTSKTYADICNNASVADNTCYIDQQTGNAYRVKIDSEATSNAEANPAWFEVGQFKGVEVGDCSSENEDYVVELASSFQPLQLSDANSQLVRAACSSKNQVAIEMAQNQPILVPFCDEDMEHEYVEQELTYGFTVKDEITGETMPSLNAVVMVSLHLKENYDVNGSDDGNSPLQSYDWGLAVAIMRGGGTSATTYAYSDNYDGFGNSKWGQTVGDYALTVDSIDHLGNRYDYNGDQEGVMKGERFSLKIRAFKQPSWADAPLCCEDSYSTTDGWYYIRGRGTFDRFLFEHANFLLNRRKFIIRCECTAAFLADIPNHWAERWNINGEIGYINKVSTSISVDSGIGESSIEFYAI